MKIYVFYVILILGFFAAVTAAVRPDVVEQKYLAIRDPIDLHFAAPREKTWKEAKDQERATWMLKHQLPVDCKYPKTAIKEMECNNKKQLLAQAFNEEWENKVRSGWKPEGAEY